MTEPFLGMIALFGFNFAPYRWAICAGQILPLSQNQALFALLGTQFGGNGQNTFALPDLQGRTAIGQGNGPGLTTKVMGERAGTEALTLLSSQMPQHVHTPVNLKPAPKGAIVAGDATTPENNYLALSPKIGSGPNATILKTYATPAAASAVADKIKPMAGNTVAGTTDISGGSQSFSILNPYLAMNYCISLTGIFPSRN